MNHDRVPVASMHPGGDVNIFVSSIKTTKLKEKRLNIVEYRREEEEGTERTGMKCSTRLGAASCFSQASRVALEAVGGKI